MGRGTGFKSKEEVRKAIDSLVNCHVIDVLKTALSEVERQAVFELDMDEYDASDCWDDLARRIREAITIHDAEMANLKLSEAEREDKNVVVQKAQEEARAAWVPATDKV
jgi:hypothetical protein